MRQHVEIHLPYSTAERVLEQVDLMKVHPEMTLRDSARFFCLTDEEAARDIIARVLEYYVQRSEGQHVLPFD